MRIIGGVAGGRRLQVPAQVTRPTTDRVREALFSSLQAHLGSWSGRRMLDLYAGSGAVGLEALSRGAQEVTLVETDRRAAAVAQRNIETVGLPGATVVHGDARSFVPTHPQDVIYIDPPYALASDAVAGLLAHLVDVGALDPEGIVVVEREARSPAPWPESGWRDLRRRDYGETALWYGQPTG